jgi:pimeloyl-ACP methyl ester carboxylesterase
METVHGDNKLRVARLGPEGAPPVVFLHGYPDNLQIWCELLPRLADSFRVIAFDWPGMGYSDAWPGGTTPMHLADRLAELLDVWHIPRASVVGLDMGGQPALVFAARHPQRIQSLIVMNSLVFGDEETSWEIRLLRQTGWNRWVLEHFPGLVFMRAEKTFLPWGVRLPRELRADLWESFRRREVRHFVARMCAGYQGTLPDLPALYRDVRCPTLALWAGKDKHFPPAHGSKLQRAVGGAVLDVIPEAQHWMPWYLAEEVSARLHRFLTKEGVH